MDEKIITALLAELEAGRAAELCLLVETHGSAPRKSGACLVLCADGRAAGTVGGGALERLVLKEGARYLAAGASAVRSFTMDGAGSDTGMICGGDARVCFLYLDGLAREGLAALLARLRAGDPCCCLIDLDEKDPCAALVVCDEAGERAEYPLAFGLSARAEIDTLRAESRGRGAAGVMATSDAFTPEVRARAESARGPVLLGRVFALPLASEGRVYVIGAGHVGAALVPVLAGIGFAVTVYDSRPELAREAAFPQADEVICAPFEELGRHVAITPRDYVVCCTPAHSADAAVLAQAMAAHPRYVGCLGSAKKTSFIRRALADAGFADADLACLHMPVGIPLGDETPAEIAISIAAEIITVRHHAPRPEVPAQSR